MADAAPPSQIDPAAIAAVVESVIAARSVTAETPCESDSVTWSDRVSPENHGLTINALVWSALGAYGARVLGDAKWEHVIEVLSQAASALGFASVPALIVGVWGVIKARPVSRAIAARRKAVPRA